MRRGLPDPRPRDWYKRRWLAGVKSRAKRAGLPWELTPETVHVPTHCPVLGMPLVFGGGNTHGGRSSSPSLDRIRPELGYVPGNCVVVSHLANSIRHRASSDQVALVASYYGQLIPPKED